MFLITKLQNCVCMCAEEEIDSHRKMRNVNLKMPALQQKQDKTNKKKQQINTCTDMYHTRPELSWRCLCSALSTACGAERQRDDNMVLCRCGR